MKFQKSPQELIDLFHQVIPKDKTRVAVRQMFGYPCAFCNGNMFMGLYENSMILRLSPDDREALILAGEARIFEPMPGRPMKEYVALPPKILKSENQLSEWINKSLRYAETLPPKQSKERKLKK